MYDVASTFKFIFSLFSNITESISDYLVPFGETTQFSPQVTMVDMDSGDERGDDHCSVPYFRSKLAAETRRLTDLCDSWEKKLKMNKEVLSDATEV